METREPVATLRDAPGRGAARHGRAAASSARAAGTPPLRLVRPRHDGRRAPAPSGPALGARITDPADPRWVLALRTAEELEGTVLRPERREALIRLGQVMGLTLFDSNLVIAIVQDQARRGFAPEYCPTAGEAQLRMVPIGTGGGAGAATRLRWALAVGTAVAAALALELFVLQALVG